MVAKWRKLIVCCDLRSSRLCIAKEIISKPKRQPMEWEKIFANDATNNGLISKIYKQLIQLNIERKIQSKTEQKI